jgi:hypothetical protein
MGVALDAEQCAYLAALIACDLGHKDLLPPTAEKLPSLYAPGDLDGKRLREVSFLELFEELLKRVPDADTYFDCLATLHKRRLKYERILEEQPFPTINQVGPRGLLQYGTLGSRALVSLLFWRKWLFDIDNRSGQETGYIFEPIVAECIGGVSYSAKKSPVRRRSNGKGRQVDCLFEKRAYEIKLRVTIAASGQGRWGEELEYPDDCQASGFIPVLLVFDDTQADKLDQLTRKFEEAGGGVLIGDNAWKHLDELAGDTMAVFLNKYVRAPLKELLDETPDRDALPDFNLSMTGGVLTISVDGESLVIQRNAEAAADVIDDGDAIPSDLD